MTEMLLTDIKWMDATLAARLASEGVTVQSMASMPAAEFYKQYPYVGTINAWLLTSEARYLVNVAGAGLWESERVEQERMAQELDDMATAQYRQRQKPEISVWPPVKRKPQYSARIKRIRLSQGLPVD